MTAVLAWLIGSRVGRALALVLISAAALGLALWSAARKGAASEQAKQLQQSLSNLRNRIATDENVSRMDRAARRDELRRWLSDD